MTREEINTMLTPFGTSSGVDIAYINFDGPPATAEYIAYLPEGYDVFGADNKMLYSSPHWRIEVYTPKKATDLIDKLLDYLTEYGVFWETEDSIIFIPEEEMYEYIIHI